MKTTRKPPWCTRWNPQVREEFDEDELQRLSESIRRKGQLTPITVRRDSHSDKFVIIAGERRWRASKLAGMEEVKCNVVDHELSEDEILELQLIENVHRQNLNAIEEAKAYYSLIKQKGCTAKDLAEELSLNKATVSRSLSLLKLPEDIQQEVAAGKLPASFARELVKLGSDDSRRDLIAKYHAGEITSGEAGKAASRRSSNGGATTKGTKKAFSSGGLKIQVTARRSRVTNAEIADVLREWLSKLENDGRGHGKAA